MTSRGSVSLAAQSRNVDRKPWATAGMLQSFSASEDGAGLAPMPRKEDPLRRIAIIVAVSTLGQASVAAGDPIREAAERAAREAVLEAAAEGLELQGSSQQRRRSIGRTVGGMVLMGLGTPMFIAGMAVSEDVGGCVGDFCFTVDPGGLGKGVAALGAGMLVSGTLLATVWSDVPVVNSLDFSVTPHRVQVGKSFGW